MKRSNQQVEDQVKKKNKDQIDLIITIGNTYERLRDNDSRVEYDTSGKHLKVHSWTLYTKCTNDKYIRGVEYVLHPSFSPRNYKKSIPPFETSQFSYGPFSVDVIITFVNDKKIQLTYELNFSQPRSEKDFIQTMDVISDDALGYLHTEPTLPGLTFGIELELMINQDNISKESILEYLDHCGVNVSRENCWKIHNDNSIKCDINKPNCFTFELVSPILRGENGLREIRNTIKYLQSMNPTVNQSSAFHVHIQAPKYDNDLFVMADLKKICQNWMKYEEGFELLVSKSRQGTVNKYCVSNRSKSRLSNSDLNDRIEGVKGLRNLIELVSGEDRYVKMNLHSLKKHSTIEFRLHQGTYEIEKIENWIKLLLLFVHNSSVGKNPTNFKDGTDTKRQFQKLFELVIQNRLLYEYYLKRMKELKNYCNGGDECHCKGCSN